MDLIIKNGIIITPSDTFTADIAVKNGRIAALGETRLYPRMFPRGLIPCVKKEHPSWVLRILRKFLIIALRKIWNGCED